jgi:hypothetical protein
MPRRELAEQQHLKVIDFLKRWGIDSPELVFELTDHYSEMALERMENGESFEKVLDSWKTKKHFRALRKIQSEFEKATKRKWWKGHISALKTVFISRQCYALMGIIILMTLCYTNDLGDVFSSIAVVIAILSSLISAYFFHSKRYGVFFEIRELTIPLMGAWYVVYFSIAHGGHEKILVGELVELPAPLVLLSIVSWFVGYNLIRQTYHEIKSITKEYLREADKYNIL